MNPEFQFAIDDLDEDMKRTAYLLAGQSKEQIMGDSLNFMILNRDFRRRIAMVWTILDDYKKRTIHPDTAQLCEEITNALNHVWSDNG